MYEYTIKVNSFDVFPNSTLKPSALLRYMQQGARVDCDRQGATYASMRELNTVFMLTKLAFLLNRPVMSDETITLKTYNNSTDSLYFDREFEIYSAEGEEIGHASSFWVLVRFDTRKPVRPREYPVEFEALHIAKEVLEIPRRFRAEDSAPLGDRIVRVSDLDENNHLNNCIYTDIALDALPGFDGLTKTVSGMKILFHHEARLHDVLALAHSKNDGKDLITAVNTTSGMPCFDAEFELASC